MVIKCDDWYKSIYIFVLCILTLSFNTLSGGFKDSSVSESTLGFFTSSFNGCIKNLSLYSGNVISFDDITDGRNVNKCDPEWTSIQIHRELSRLCCSWEWFPLSSGRRYWGLIMLDVKRAFKWQKFQTTCSLTF